jgi:hypothetical protein
MRFLASHGSATSTNAQRPKLVGAVVGIAAGEPGPVLGLELVDLAGGELLEIGAHRLARFQLLAIHQHGPFFLGRAMGTK